jgi:hypothetical protein
MHECPIGGHQVVQRTNDRLKLCYLAWHVSWCGGIRCKLQDMSK